MNIRLYTVCLLICVLVVCVHQGNCNDCMEGERLCWTYDGYDYHQECYNETTHSCCGYSVEGGYDVSSGYGGGDGTGYPVYGTLCDFPSASCCEGGGWEVICYDPEIQFCCTQPLDNVHPKACEHNETCVSVGDYQLDCTSPTQFICMCYQSNTYWAADHEVCDEGEYCRCLPEVWDTSGDYQYEAVCSDHPACDSEYCLECRGNASVCTKCTTGALYLYNGVCLTTCPVGYYPFTGQICQACPLGCSSCSVWGVCLTCSTGYYYVNSRCVTTCPTGTTPNPATAKCDDFNECSNSTACPPTYTCKNTVGSYTCTPPTGPNCASNQYFLALDNSCQTCYTTATLPGPYYAYERTNIALNKTTSVSTTYTANFPPSYAVDTLTYLWYESASVAVGEILWWQVDLSGTYAVSEVRVVCKQRNVQAFSLIGKLLNESDIVVSLFTITFGTNDLPFVQSFSPSVNASKLRIELQATASRKNLQIAEVEVYPETVNATKLYGGYPNIAVSKRASQLTEISPRYAANAVDHNLATYQQSQEIDADRLPVWTLNLGLEHTISGLNLVPRVDYGAHYFCGYTITLRNLKNEVVATLSAGDKNLRNFSYTFQPMVTAIYVRIDQIYTNNCCTYMNMAEFELYGYVANSTLGYQQCTTSIMRCSAGFYKNGNVCVDYDECLYPVLNNCASLGRVCRNTNGGYACDCSSGYGGPNCTDINECNNPFACPDGKKCNNTVGSFSCLANKQYFLTSKHTGFVATAGASAGASVVVAPKKSSDFTDQLWSYVPGEGGFFQNVGTGFVLDIKSGSASAGADLITWPKKSGYNLNQQWSYNNATFVFKSKILNSNLVFDVKSGSTKPNTPLIVWTPKSPTNNQNQQFELVEHVN